MGRSRHGAWYDRRHGRTRHHRELPMQAPGSSLSRRGRGNDPQSRRHHQSRSQAACAESQGDVNLTMAQLVEHAKSRTIVPVSFEFDVESKERTMLETLAISFVILSIFGQKSKRFF